MKCFAIATALAFLGGCAAVSDEELRDDVTDSNEVWITIGPDALETVQSAIDQGLIDGTVELYQKGDRAAVMRLSNDHIDELTRLMHDTFNRCGGYVAHDSLTNAVKALDEELAAEASQKVFAGYSIDNGTVVQSLLGSLDEARIRSTITTLSSYTSRYYTTQGGVDAANWLRNQWLGYAEGRSDVTVQLYSHSGYSQPSVIMTVTGDTYPNEVVVLGAHLDSTSSGSTAPGADDDASGVATLSEVIRVALNKGFKPDRTVKFMAYAAEEVGLRGSGDIAAAHQSAGTNVIGVMQLDMTNYKGSTTYDIVLISDNTNAAQNTFVGNLIDTYLSLAWTYTSCGYACSDHASWHSRGFVASFPFEAQFSNYNPYIHTTSDTLSRSGGNANHALKFAKVAAAYLAELAKGALDGEIGGGNPPPPPDETTETFNGSVAQGASNNYGPFAVEPGTTFTASITGSGDADLYVRFGAAPTTSAYDCRPYQSGSSETCQLTVPSNQTQAYVMVRGYSASTYTLTVTYTENDGGGGGGGGTPTTETFNDSVATGASDNFGPFSVVAGTTFTAQITGTGDADLYVRFGAAPTTSAYDCRPYKSGSSETCTLTVPTGQSSAYVMVRGYSSSTYTLTVTYTKP